VFHVGNPTILLFGGALRRVLEESTSVKAAHAEEDLVTKMENLFAAFSAVDKIVKVNE